MRSTADRALPEWAVATGAATSSSAIDVVSIRHRDARAVSDFSRGVHDSRDAIGEQNCARAREAFAVTIDVAAPARPVAMELIGGRGHYERVIRAVLEAHTSVWISTANVKALLIEDGRARPGRRRSTRSTSYVSILAMLDDLAARGVELRLLHAELPSRPFREELAQHPRLLGALALRRCPRVHLKVVVVDGALLYLGSANWTGAGLGAKGSGRRNFELGIVTDDAPLLDQVQAMYEQIWRGGECAGCKLREECPGPLDEIERAEQGSAIEAPREAPAKPTRRGKRASGTRTKRGA